MCKIFQSFMFYLVAILVAMASASEEVSMERSSLAATMVNKPLLEFTSKIFKSFAGQENVILSPISIHKGLSMVLLGADNGTQTKNELLDSLGLKNLKEDEVNKCLQDYSALIAEFKKITKESLELYKEREKQQDPDRGTVRQPPILDIFNMVITKDQGDVLPAYEEKVKKYFDSSIVKVDDGKPETKSDVLNRLNGWGKEAGFKGPIMEQKELDEKFAAFLISAIRVQGFWFEDFSEYEQTEPIFFNHGKKDQPVNGYVLSQSKLHNTKYLEFTPADKAHHKSLHQRMSQSSYAKVFAELSSLNMQVAEVPLQGGLSFTILEPRSPSGQGGELDKLVEHLMQMDKSSSTTKLEQVFSLLDSKLGDNRIDSLSFPKFGFENNIDLKSQLQSIGLKRAFDDVSAEISNMTTRKLFIQKITHQAMIDVNKFGIKAAGVTKIKLMLLSAFIADNPIYVRIKNPFLFFIRYRELPLFVGRLDTLNK